MKLQTFVPRIGIAAIGFVLSVATVLSAKPIPLLLSQQLDQEINTVLNLEYSWHTTLRIDPTPGRKISIEIPIANVTYTLELEPNSVRADEYTVLMQDEEGELYEVPAGPVRTLRGTLLEVPGSVVAGSLMEDGLYARIRLGNGEEVWLEPIGDRVKGSQEDLYAFYFTHDVMDSGGICGTEDYESHVNVKDILSMLANYEANTAQRGTIICTTQLAFDTDYEYWQDHQSQTENRINQVVNSINIQYEDEVSVTFEITHIIVRNTSNDPYTTTDCGNLLDQFEDEWSSNHWDIIRDIAHLFTGKNLADCVGIAATPGVCYSWGYGLSQSDYGNNYSYTTQVTAHELGHGFDGSHQTSPYYNTMYPSINGGNTFNSTSVAEITNYVNSINCLSCENSAPSGACCIGNNCVEIYQSNCDAGGGIWQGNNTTCASSSCVAPVGACCVGNNCVEYDQDDCSASGGTYYGDETNCSTVSCALGACCTGVDCSVTLQSDCTGSWYGDNTSCADVSCGDGADELNYEMRSWSRSDGQSMSTFDIYFPSTDPNTRMVSVFGEGADLLQIRGWSNSNFDNSASLVAVHQSVYGDDTVHDRSLDPLVGDDLVYDSYVTVGSDDAAVGVPLMLGFDSDGFNSDSGVTMDNGVWFVTPDDPLASIGAGTALGHRVISISVEAGQGVELLTNIQWFDGAGIVHETRNIYWNNEGIGPVCETDIDGNGSTDVSDLLEIIGQWGSCSGCSGDLDGSGAVDVTDILLVIGAWGPC